MRQPLAFLVLFTVILSINAQDNCSLMHHANWIWEGSDTADLKRTTVQISFAQESFEIDTILRAMQIGSQNCMMSDEFGTLLFYSNGCAIANSQNEIVLNGEPLNPGNVFDMVCTGHAPSYIGSQGMFSVPAPHSDSIYYIFHKKFEDLFIPSFHVVVDHLYVTVINPFLNYQSGLVLEKNIPVVIDTNIISSNFTATRHADGESWWIITHTAYGNGFYRILLDSSGISQLEMQFIGGTTSPKNDAGQAKFSPDGSKFAMYHSKSGVFLFDFDRSSGLLSNYQSFGPIDSNFIIGGCEFSPSGRFLYINTMRDVYQYDMEAKDIPASEVHLGHYDGFLSPFATLFYHMERTPHGQIFMNSPNQVNVLHVIEAPDKKGLECNFKQHGIILPANIFWSMPHFPNYRLGALEDPLCDTTVSVIDDVVTKRDLLIFPNPVNDVLSITTKERMNSISVYTLSGIQVQQHIIAGTETNLSLDKLDSGFYLVEIVFTDGARVARKIILQK